MSGETAGSSSGTLVGAIVGGIVGYFVGSPYAGAMLGASIGGAIGGLVDALRTPAKQGPKLDDLTVQTATYGAFIPRVYGKITTFGNIFWLENNQLKETEETGKGGSSVVGYKYSATFAVGLCEGPISGISRIWLGAMLVYDINSGDPNTVAASIEFTNYFVLYYGTNTQMPDPRMEADIGVNLTPAYRGLAYIVFYDLPLDNYQNSLVAAQVKVEIGTSEFTSLGSIVSGECLQSSVLTASDLDVGGLTDNIRGYRISTLSAIRSGIDPLRAGWPFDCIQHGYKIKFKRRGSTESIVTIPSTLLDARGADKNQGIQITNSREMDSILPKKVSVKYFDMEREYDIGEQFAERINTDAVSISSVDLATSMNTPEAAGKAQVLLYLYWLERYFISFSLPPEYCYLEVADIITITTDYAVYVLRLTAITYNSDGCLDCQAKYHKSAIYVPTALGAPGQSTGQTTVALAGDSVYELMDVPMLRDELNTPSYILAMTGELPGWRGGALYKSTDSGASFTLTKSVSRPGATMGVALNSLTVHNGNMYDKTSLLSVDLYQGTLSSITETQLLAGSLNRFAYGKDQRWEIIATQNCVLQLDGTYLLSDFLRGQFGTEWATGLHEIDDSVVLLSVTFLEFIFASSVDIGVSAIYRGISVGKPLDSDADNPFTYRGVNLECLSPCQFSGSINPLTHDWTLTWVRRSRFMGWANGVDAQLGEATESYEIDIFTDDTYLTVMRTLSSSAPTVEYTSAQQVTDFGGNKTSLFVKIYQLSSVVGRGYPLTDSVTR